MTERSRSPEEIDTTVGVAMEVLAVYFALGQALFVANVGLGVVVRVRRREL